MLGLVFGDLRLVFFLCCCVVFFWVVLVAGVLGGFVVGLFYLLFCVF